MRKEKYQQAKKFVALLGQINIQIEKKINKGNYESIISIIEESKVGIQLLQKKFSKEQKTYESIVKLLKNYIDAINRISVDLQISNMMDFFDYQLLSSLQNELEKKLDNDIKIHHEVVFLPYKVSMWDSLESVWKAADEDPNCQAYVIPIPYYDKNADGSFGEMHYEGTLYPEYVPITDYNKYDFVERRPDMIFIHNPYDDSNIVTSVHPDFYSNRLKKYTEQLVYIPYFLLEEIKLNEILKIKSIEHFCMTPGVINADKVVVQSENIRQIYIETLLRYTNIQDRGYLKNKIIGLGTPKVDKILSIKKEDLEIPDEWLRLIVKPDGTWKKIIFYNTSIAALLNYNEAMLKKIKWVLQTFKNNKEDTILLWRPHPLMKQTIETMRPNLWSDYKDIVRQYREEAWGIYDDTSEMDMAIVLCDAYYGDYSSVVWLCQKIGKPVMIQGVDVNL